MNEVPRGANVLELRYVERGRSLRGLRKHMKAGVLRLRRTLRKHALHDVSISGPRWEAHYFHGGALLEKYLPLALSERLTGQERRVLEPVFAQLNGSVDWPWAMCDLRRDLVTLRVGNVKDCLECRKLDAVERARTRMKKKSPRA